MRASSQSWAVSIPAQAAGVAALKENDFVQKTVSLIREEQQYIASELRSMGILCYPPSANYIFFKEFYSQEVSAYLNLKVEIIFLF